MQLRSTEILRAHMAHRGYSIQGLATKAQCSKSFIGFLTTGRKDSCTPELAARIADVLEVPVSDLFVARLSAASVAIARRERVA